jgi:NAD-dependent epimerase/dehydratase family protein
MRLLILGGTVFLGRAVARLARDAGHDVTCAARGSSGSPVDGVRFVPVDRSSPGGLSGLDGETFDAVVDVSRVPSHVSHALSTLASRVGHWSFVSTCNVYADDATPGQRAATAQLVEPAPASAEGDESLYGRLKVTCEELVRAAFPDAAFVCRAGLIVGPEDRSDRFPYWVRRMRRGGEVLAPGSPDDDVQLVDVDDLAAWLLSAPATGLSGTYDGMGAPMPRSAFLAALVESVAPPGTTLTWVDQEFLVARDVRPWSGERALPLWLPLPEYGGFLSRDVHDSLAAGLRIRPLGDTARRTLEWVEADPTAVKDGGLSADDEAAVLREWHSRQA